MTEQVIHHPIFLQSHAIAAFCAHNGEMNPALIVQTALKMTKSCYLPVLDNQLKNHLIFTKIDNHSRYTKNKYGILEPKPKPSLQPIPAGELDLVLVPLVGIDKVGHRLGMGAGCYDRTFEFKKRNTKPYLIGLAYTFQCIENIPYDAHDIPLDGVATENELILF